MATLDCGHVNDWGKYFMGKTDEGKTACKQCCSDIEKEFLVKSGKGILYDNNYYLSDFSGKLTIMVDRIRTGRHNIARRQYHYWFTFDGSRWHGVRYGDMTQIVRVRRLKS